MAQPEKRFKCGACDASVFENEIGTGGKKAKLKKLSFQKRYKRSDGEWASTNSLDLNDIPKAILVLQKAYEYLVVGDEKEEAGLMKN
jgi:hypothetical protein